MGHAMGIAVFAAISVFVVGADGGTADVGWVWAVSRGWTILPDLPILLPEFLPDSCRIFAGTVAGGVQT